MILSAEHSDLRKLIRDVRGSGLLYLGFIREMIETTDDVELANVVRGKEDDELEYLAIGIFGNKELVGSLTKKFSLWK